METINFEKDRGVIMINEGSSVTVVPPILHVEL